MVPWSAKSGTLVTRTYMNSDVVEGGANEASVGTPGTWETEVPVEGRGCAGSTEFTIAFESVKKV